jgi:hypothetical protein
MLVGANSYSSADSYSGNSYTGITTIVPGTLVIGTTPALSSALFAATTANFTGNQIALAPATTNGVILTAVPEPSGVLLAGLSLAAFFHARRVFGRKS